MTCKQLVWYPYFNNEINSSKDVLMRNELIYLTDIIIARMVKDKSPQFTKLNNIDEFITLYNKFSIDDRTFYAVLVNDLRYLYIDIDYPLKKKMDINAKNQLIIQIINALNKFNYIYASKYKMKIHKKQWMIWDATRDNKFSLHMINDDIICHCEIMHKYIIEFGEWVKKNNIISINCVIDTSVYSTKYQLWKLPGNHGGNINSYLRLITYDLLPTQPLFINKYKLSFKHELQKNFMHQIKQKCWHNNHQQKRYGKSMSNNNISINRQYDNNNEMNQQDSYDESLSTNNITIKKQCNNNNEMNQNNDYEKSVLTNRISIKKQCGNNIEMNLQIIDAQNEKYEKILHKIFGQEYKLTMITNKNICNDVKRINKHWCPIAKRIHKSNSGKIQLYIKDHLKYIKYFCMDEDCHNKWEYYSLTTGIIRPWLFITVSDLNKKIIYELDVFINLLLKQRIICYAQNILKHEIISMNTIILYKNNDIFSTFMHNNVIHYQCSISDMSLSYKNPNHKYIKFGKITLYCRNCKKFYNFSNGRIFTYYSN